MPEQLFVTGATGFIGRRLLAALDRRRFGAVTSLVRVPGALAGERVVVGRLEDASSYEGALGPATTVVHLAGLTGKAAPERYVAVNVEGTSRLVAACRRAGVRRFVHVSTIAVKYPDKRWYPYARSKEAAETIVRESGLDYLIVRPTIALGPGSPAAAGLGRLARSWLTIVPGRGRARIQPIHVDDLARVLAALVAEARFAGETVELGGPEVVEVGELLRLLSARGGRRPPALHVPLAPLVAILGRVEGMFLPILPITAGQLSVFAQDGIIEPHPAVEGWAPMMKSVEAMVRAAASTTDQHEGADALDSECAVFARYLCGQAPTEYVRRKYREAHERLDVLGEVPTDRFDRVLVALAARRPALTRLADAYARSFAPRARVRAKLIVLLAILESCAPSHRHWDAPDACGVPRLMVRAVGQALASATALLGALLVLRPLHLLMGRGAAPAGK